jgi:lipopolysaccharide/colanic/teichoic acid biosynthesis glycosyltransferase
MTPATEAAIEPSIGSRRARKVRIQRIAQLPVVVDTDAPAAALPDARTVFYCRILNVAAAIVMIVLLSPLFLLIALLVKLSSRGPVIYTQTRVGIDRRRPDFSSGDERRLVDYGGKLFTIYKFRTMAADERSKLQIWAQPNDARITRIGRVLRTFRLDELPQLYNVLRGDMNIVGPRPEQPNIFLTLREQVDYYAERQRVLPGITGWAQINHRYDESVDDVRTKVAYDLEYIRRQSVMTDLDILFRTLPVMLFRRGAL